MRREVEQAVELLQQNHSDALDRALALLQQTVFAFSMKVCGHREDAEDTMQEVLLKSVDYLPKFDSPKALLVWLYTVAKNRCLMNRRRSKFAPNKNLSLDELMPDGREFAALAQAPYSGPEEIASRGENASFVRDLILKVPPQYRLILVLHDMEELTTEEIANITRLRPGTVRVRLHRGRLFLRRELAKSAIDSPPKEPTPRKTAQPRPAECRAMFAALSDYLDGALPDDLCQHMRQHIGNCQPCLSFVETLRQTVETVRKLPPGKPDPAVAARIRQQLLPQVREIMSRAEQARAAGPA